MKINVVGLGYIGLPTSLTMANAGFTVVGQIIIKGWLKHSMQEKLHLKKKD